MWLRDKGLAGQSIATYISAMRAYVAITTGYEMRRSALLNRLLLRYIAHSEKRKIRAPATKELLRAVLDSKEVDPAIKLACQLAFDGLLRVCEYAAAKQHGQQQVAVLAQRHVRMQKDNSAFWMTLVRLKNDPARVGKEVIFEARPASQYCVVRRMQEYLRWRRRQKIADNTAPLLLTKAGTYVTKRMITKTLQRFAEDAGLPRDQISTHSLRVGGAFELRDNGASWQDIMLRGRWSARATNRMAVEYARFSKKRQRTITKGLALDGPSAIPLIPKR